jgi:hypothetical protein
MIHAALFFAFLAPLVLAGLFAVCLSVAAKQGDERQDPWLESERLIHGLLTTAEMVHARAPSREMGLRILQYRATLRLIDAIRHNDVEVARKAELDLDLIHLMMEARWPVLTSWHARLVENAWCN